MKSPDLANYLPLRSSVLLVGKRERNHSGDLRVHGMIILILILKK